MRLLGSSIAVPLVFSVYVAGEHGYLCSDAGGNTNTTYDQALVEKSVTDACLPDSELTAAQLAANVEAKKYPQVWVDSEDYGFNETVLFWKYQGNSTETQEELEVLVFTNKDCKTLGLLQKSGDEYTICQSVNEEDIKNTSAEISHKKPRPGMFMEYEDDVLDFYPGRGDSPDDAIVIPQEHYGAVDSNGYVMQAYPRPQRSSTPPSHMSNHPSRMNSPSHPPAESPRRSSSRGLWGLLKGSSRAGSPRGGSRGPSQGASPVSSPRGGPRGPPQGLPPMSNPSRGLVGSPQGAPPMNGPPQGYWDQPGGRGRAPERSRIDDMMALYPYPRGDYVRPGRYDPNTYISEDYNDGY